MLTPQQTECVRIIPIWTKHFRATAKKLGSKWWRFGRPTLDMLGAIKSNDTTAISRLFNSYYDSHFVLWAINYREKKVISVSWKIPNFTEDLVILDHYDPDYINFPELIFVGISEESSFQHFYNLFERFLTIRTEADYDAFNTYLSPFRYRSDDPESSTRACESGQCPL